MDIERLKEEVHDLQRDYPVKWSLSKQYVMITRFGYPRGWSPRTAPLFLSLPYAYPRMPPEVYLPPQIEYTRGRAEHQLHPNEDGWYKWCVERIDWHPEYHTLYTVVELMKRSLMKPNEARIID